MVLPDVIGLLRDDLLAVICEEFQSIQQQLLPPVGPSHSGPSPLPGLVSAALVLSMLGLRSGVACCWWFVVSFMVYLVRLLCC